MTTNTHAQNYLSRLLSSLLRTVQAYLLCGINKWSQYTGKAISM